MRVVHLVAKQNVGFTTSSDRSSQQLVLLRACWPSCQPGCPLASFGRKKQTWKQLQVFLKWIYHVHISFLYKISDSYSKKVEIIFTATVGSNQTFTSSLIVPRISLSMLLIKKLKNHIQSPRICWLKYKKGHLWDWFHPVTPHKTEKCTSVSKQENVWEIGLDFINVLRTAFTLIAPQSKRTQSSCQYFFTLLGSTSIKAVRRMLMKLSPGLTKTSN